MKNLIKNLTVRDIDGLTLSLLSEFITDPEAKNYFLEEAGKEHYKLLAYFSTLFNDTQITDIGTYKGCSALALSFNKTNTIYSFDVVDNRKLSNLYNINNLQNIIFILSDCVRWYKDILLKSKIIFLDVNHDGEYEYKVFNCLIENNYKGYLILDDINLNQTMKNFWTSITKEKIELTHLGHFSGTGLVYFD